MQRRPPVRPRHSCTTSYPIPRTRLHPPDWKRRPNSRRRTSRRRLPPPATPTVRMSPEPAANSLLPHQNRPRTRRNQPVGNNRTAYRRIPIPRSRRPQTPTSPSTVALDNRPRLRRKVSSSHRSTAAVRSLSPIRARGLVRLRNTTAAEHSSLRRERRNHRTTAIRTTTPVGRSRSPTRTSTAGRTRVDSHHHRRRARSPSHTRSRGQRPMVLPAGNSPRADPANRRNNPHHSRRMATGSFCHRKASSPRHLAANQTRLPAASSIRHQTPGSSTNHLAATNSMVRHQESRSHQLQGACNRRQKRPDHRPHPPGPHSTKRPTSRLGSTNLRLSNRTHTPRGHKELRISSQATPSTVGRRHLRRSQCPTKHRHRHHRRAKRHRRKHNHPSLHRHRSSPRPAIPGNRINSSSPSHGAPVHS